MSLTDTEKRRVTELRGQGHSLDEIMGYIGGNRANRSSTIAAGEVAQFEQQQSPVNNTAADLTEGFIKGAGDTVQGIGTLGRSLQAAVDPFNTTADYNKQAETQPWYVSPFSGKNAQMIDQKLTASNDTQRVGKVLEFGAEALLPSNIMGKVGGMFSKLAAPFSKGVSEIAAKGATELAAKEAVTTEPTAVSGMVQSAKELADRVPRFVSHVSDNLEQAGARAERIKTADPVTREAIKSGLDERFTNTVHTADPESLKKYREVLNIADDPATTIKPKERPEIVAGNVASDQYKLIASQKQQIGKQIGAVVDSLSKKGAVDVLPAQRQMRDVLRLNGIEAYASGELKFTGKFTPAERTKIQELYRLATEGGETLTPRQVYDMDHLFSKLQREARFENIGDVVVNTKTGDMSLFRVFRDIYSNQLEQVAPAIRPLNREYRNYATLTDDIEKSIVKSGHFKTTANVDDAEFAQTNLRRLFSETNSAADYRAIYEEMDALSRHLGYKGARADDLAAFAYELRKLYPETTPRTGFEGGIRGVLGGIVNKVAEVGAPNVEDQRKALRALIESRLTGAKGPSASFMIH